MATSKQPVTVPTDASVDDFGGQFATCNSVRRTPAARYGPACGGVRTRQFQPAATAAAWAAPTARPARADAARVAGDSALVPNASTDAWSALIT